MANFDDVIKMTSHLDEVTVSTSYGTPALKVRGKMFARLWGDRDYHKSERVVSEVLVVYCDIDEKNFLIAESDGSLFTAPHYDGHPSVLIDLDLVDNSLLERLLVEGYLERAPSALRRKFSAD